MTVLFFCEKVNSNSLFFKENEKEQDSLLFWVAKRGGGVSLRLVFPVFLHLSFGFGSRELVFFYDEGFRFVIRRT